MKHGGGETLELGAGTPLVGEVTVPGDKSVSHRALLVASLAEGRSRLRGLSDGGDVARTAAALISMGARIDGEIVHGTGGVLLAPAGPLDMGNSGTSLRLIAGTVAAYPFEVVLAGDDSLSSRPMDRVALPLRLMGAEVSGRGERCMAPVTVRGGALHGIDYTPPVASSQVKSCVLFAGLGADGDTVVREPVPTRRHTEELLVRAGADIEVSAGAVAYSVRVRRSRLGPLELLVPGDPSQAAFWVVGATIVPGSDVTVRAVYTGPQRRGFLDVLARMGASIEEQPTTVPGSLDHVVDLHVVSASLHAAEVDATEITGLDEVPVLALAAAVADGTTVLRDMGELRVKESDRFAAVLAMLNRIGARAWGSGDDLYIEGPAPLRAAPHDAAGDHRMAMAGAIATLAAPSGTGVVQGWEAVATSYPGFAATLGALTGQKLRLDATEHAS
ncbi:MAG: 3-phosphoshikimate 1-carboxyvinyltransferase [Acidimicrobiales bacterium]